jgi:hypothetical protein
MSRAPELDHALDELLRRCLDWVAASTDARCTACGVRADRSPQAVLVANQARICERIKERVTFHNEAPTVPKTPRRKT